MKELLIKIVLFSIFLNMSIAIMHNAIPGFDDPTLAMGLGDGNMSEAETGITELSSDLTPEALVEDESDLLDRFLDSIGLGIFSKVKSFLDTWMFSFVNMLQSLVGGFMSDTLNTLIFGGMKTTITILYIVTAIWLLTGKDIGDKY